MRIPTRTPMSFASARADDILRPARRAPDTEFSIPELIRRHGCYSVDGLAGRRSSTVSTPSRFEKRLNATTSRSSPDRLQKDDLILGISNQNSRADPSVRRPRQATTADADDISDLLWDRHLWKRLARGERPTERYRFVSVVVDGNRTTARRQITDVVADPNRVVRR